MTDGAYTEKDKEEPQETDLDQLLADSAALMQRWKKASCEILKDSLGIGHEIVPLVHTAAHAFQTINDKLSSYGRLDEVTEHNFF